MTDAAAEPEPPARDPYLARKAQYYALGLLVMIHACHSMDRGIVGVVTEPIHNEFGATDTQIGLISLGFTFALLAAVVPMGILIDRVSRVRLHAILVATWSSLTALAGLATSMGGLIAARMGVGAAEAGGHPNAMSLISDIFPRSRRGSAIGIFHISNGIGGTLAFLVGGWVAAEHGWRMTFFLAGVPGVLLALVCLLTFREPKRGRTEPMGPDTSSEPAPPYRAVLRFVVTSPALLNLLVAGLLASVVASSFGNWQASYFMRTHGLDLKEIGIVGGLGNGVLQAIGAPIAGVLADWFGRRRFHRSGYVGTMALLLMAPLGVGFTLSPHVGVAIGLSLVMGFAGGFWMAPLFALVLSVADPRMRGRVMSMMQILLSFGAGVGPFLVGMMSDALGGRIHIALAIGLGAAAWAAVHSFIGVRLSAKLVS